MINTVCVSVCARSCACTLFLQLYPTLCGPMDRRPLGFSVHGISQARMLEQAAFPTPGDLPDPGIKPASLASPALAGGFFTTSTTWEAVHTHTHTHTHVQRYIDVCVCVLLLLFANFLLQGIFPTQRLNPRFLYCKQVLYH